MEVLESVEHRKSHTVVLLISILLAGVWGGMAGCGGSGTANSGSTSPAASFSVNDRVMAVSNGAPVWNAALTSELFLQTGGVHGTILAGPTQEKLNNGTTENWWKVQWDSEPPDLSGGAGSSTDASLALAPLAGDVAEPNLQGTSYGSKTNIFWAAGYAPASTNPPTPQLGSALGNCTWYASGRLLELGAMPSKLDALYGNAGQWASEAEASGISVDTTPTVHSIAELDSTSGYPDGHVAVVESVNADGTITVTESSYDPDPTSAWDFEWRHRTVAPAWFSHFIHVL
jgi:surface antigen